MLRNLTVANSAGGSVLIPNSTRQRNSMLVEMPCARPTAESDLPEFLASRRIARFSSMLNLRRCSFVRTVGSTAAVSVKHASLASSLALGSILVLIAGRAEG